MGGRPDLQGKIQDAEKPEARQHSCRECQKACLEVLPAKDGAQPHGPIPALDEIPSDPPVLVVPAPQADKRTPLERVPEVEETAEDAVEGGVGRDW